MVNSLSKASSKKGSRHGHVKSSTSSFSVGGGDRRLNGAAALETGEALGLLVSGTMYVFLMTGVGLLGSAVSPFGTITGLESLWIVTGKELFGTVSVLQLFGIIGKLVMLGIATGLEIFATGLESLGTDTGLALLGNVTGLGLFGMVPKLAIFGTIIELVLFGTGLERLRPVTGLSLLGTATVFGFLSVASELSLVEIFITDICVELMTSGGKVNPWVQEVAECCT